MYGVPMHPMVPGGDPGPPPQRVNETDPNAKEGGVYEYTIPLNGAQTRSFLGQETYIIQTYNNTTKGWGITEVVPFLQDISVLVPGGQGASRQESYRLEKKVEYRYPDFLMNGFPLENGTTYSNPSGRALRPNWSNEGEAERIDFFDPGEEPAGGLFYYIESPAVGPGGRTGMIYATRGVGLESTRGQIHIQIIDMHYTPYSTKVGVKRRQIKDLVQRLKRAIGIDVASNIRRARSLSETRELEGRFSRNVAGVIGSFGGVDPLNVYNPPNASEAIARANARLEQKEREREGKCSIMGGRRTKSRRKQNKRKLCKPTQRRR